MSLMIASLLDRWFPVRQGTGSCACGAVHLQFTVPGSSYSLLDQTMGLCHCHDCVGFVQSLGDNGRKCLSNNNASPLVNFYPTDIQVIKGSQHVGMLKLRSNTPFIRCYCRNCGTPLGAQLLNGLPLVIIYPHLLTNYSVFFLPSMVFFFDSAIDGTRDYGGCAVVRRGVMAPRFLLRAIGRVLVGLLFGKRGDGLLPSNFVPDDIPVGIESIVIGMHKAT